MVMQIDWNIFSPDKIRQSYILLKNKSRAYVSSYVDMQVLFCKRTYIIDGKSKETELPQIVYKVKMDETNRKILYKLYKNNNNLGAISSKPSFFIIQPLEKEERFTCRCSVEAYPPFLIDEERKSSPSCAEIKIKISMEAPNQPMYELMKKYVDLYEEGQKDKQVDRFELMDLD